MIESRIGPLDIDTVVRGYLRSMRRPLNGDAKAVYDQDDPDEIADDAMRTAIFQAPARTAWELVRALIRRAPDDELGFHATGALEDLVSQRGAELIDEIEAEAERDARFRWAFGCLWLSHGELPADVLERVIQASGGEIRPLPPLEELARRHSPDGSDG
jgi:hypothetical protein